MKRRDFLKAVGASTGLMSIPGCTTQPKRSPAGAKVKKKSLNEQRAVIQAENAGGGEETVTRCGNGFNRGATYGGKVRYIRAILAPRPEFSGTARVEERVKAVTAQVLNIKPGEIKLEDSFTADLGAESVQSIELVAMFEEEFGIEMNEDAALSVDTVGKAIEFITKVCKEQGIDVE